MDWIDKVFGLVAVLFGWLLGQYGSYFTQKKNDKRKLKKLLFNLLNLRWLLKIELNLESDLHKILTEIQSRIYNEGNNDKEMIETEIKKAMPIITKLFKERLDVQRLKNVEENIDSTISELSEIYPVLAYQSDGEYRIKERLGELDDYYKNVEQYLSEEDLVMKDKMQPKIVSKLMEKLDKSIIDIAKKVSSKVKRKVSKVLEEKKVEDNEELRDFFDDLLANKK